ncbi:hypothetical protein KKC88_06565 [Patescibacteria group bacterium]|nr:hypothetical protein [Patescibacteria group bacterium]MBU1673139.1 hypothetical protein [Patescibacteria group bacterium]MBU1963405.1 hypothetical protein [Patescibacteria group bacterium]
MKSKRKAFIIKTYRNFLEIIRAIVASESGAFPFESLWEPYRNKKKDIDEK